MAKGRIIEGLGIVFNKESNDLGGFREVIAPQAVGQGGKVLRESDILFLINHSYSRGVLARSNKGKGSMTVSVLPEGVQYRFETPPTAIGEELAANIERGEVNTSSFSFLIAPKGETWEKRKGDYLRTITEFSGIFDFSAVYNAAYNETTCYMRNEEVLARNDDRWQEGFARAQRSGSPKEEQRKMRNVLELLDIKEGDRVSGDELMLMVRLLEERGVEVPASMTPTAKELHKFKTAYYERANDVKPQIQRAYKMTAEEQQLFDEYEKLKGKR